MNIEELARRAAANRVGVSDPSRVELSPQFIADAREIARLVAEECAKVCDNVQTNYTKHHTLGAKECAAAIREAFK